MKLTDFIDGFRNVVPLRVVDGTVDVNVDAIDGLRGALINWGQSGDLWPETPHLKQTISFLTGVELFDEFDEPVEWYTERTTVPLEDDAADLVTLQSAVLCELEFGWWIH